MNIEDLIIGKSYSIFYVDTNYPCKCPCHTPGIDMRHIISCCSDKSLNLIGCVYLGILNLPITGIEFEFFYENKRKIRIREHILKLCTITEEK